MARLPAVRSALRAVPCALALLALVFSIGCPRGADPEDSARLAMEGLTAWRGGDFATAAARFREATEKDDSNRHAWFGLGAAALRVGDGAAAREGFEKFLALAPRDAAAEAGLGLAYAKLGDRANALMHVGDSVKLVDTDVAVQDLKRRLEDNAEVRNFALPAIDSRVDLIDPDLRKREIVRLQISGLSKVRDTDYRNAEHDYEAAVRLDPGDATSQLGLGATAILGSQVYERAERAIEAFRNIEPDSAAGEFCLAALTRLAKPLYENIDTIIEHFRRAEARAPNDQDVAFHLACALRDKEEIDPERKPAGALEEFQRSLALNVLCPSTHRHLNSLYAAKGDTARAAAHLAEFEHLQRDTTSQRRFPLRAKENPWSAVIDARLAKIDRSVLPADEPATAIRLSFEPKPLAAEAGAAPSAGAAADFDGDCDLDVLTAGVVLLRNDAGVFVPMPDAIPTAIVGGAFREVHVADFDNDDAIDALLVGGGRAALLLGDGAGKFRDATDQTGLARIPAESAVVFDYDHEGDVDVLLVVRDGKDGGSRSTRMLLNALPPRIPANATQQEKDEFAKAKLSFLDVTAASGIAAQDTSLALAVGDVENGNDTDVVVLGAASSHLFTNLRGGTFRDVAPATGVASLRGVAAELEDLDADGWLDLLTIDPAGALSLSRNRGDGTFEPAQAIAGESKTACFALLDADNDGALDLAASTEKGLRLLRNAGGRFEDASTATRFGVIAEPATSLLAADVDSDGDDDVVAFLASPSILRNDGGNANHRIALTLRGDLSNRLAIGAKVEVADDAFFAKREVKRLPLTIGVGPRTRLQSLFVLWTNGVKQPYREVDLQDASWMNDWSRNGPLEVEARCGGWSIRQLIRNEGSCPLLYAFDGERFRYVTDALCSAVLGLDIGGGMRAMPNPSDAVLVRGDQLKAKDGRYRLAFTEELRELTYLDWIQLVAIDHPSDVSVFTDNKFTFPPFPEYEVHKAAAIRPIAKATDSQGADVTELLAAVDRRTVDSFAKCAPPMQGMAETHTLEIDLGAFESAHGARTARLFLRGWFAWTNSSVNSALAQDATDGWEFMPPMLDVADGKGGWIPRGMAGIPAGDNKLIIVDVSGAFPSDDHRVRLTTNLQIYWDHAFVATDADPRSLAIETHELAPIVADLHYRGYSEQVLPDGKEPNDYDYEKVTTDGSTYGTYYARFAGRLTRYGDVLPLLDAIDDQYAIIHHGDECMLEFDAAALPPLRDGWTRDFVFRSYGWAKDMDFNTAAATTVEPLPFRGMSAYPPPPGENYPDDEVHRRYRAEWNTRISTPTAMTSPPIPKPKPAARTPHVAFTDVTRESGVVFHHAEGRVLVNLEDTMGAGAAWGDYDGDGDDDLFLVQGLGPGYRDVYPDRYHHRLFRNDGGDRFTDVTLEAGVGGYGAGMAALFADFDGDSDQDLFVTQNGENILYRNEGNATFRDVTASSGLAGSGYHSGIAAGDYDRDGDLDLYVGRYVTIDPANRPQEAPGFGRGFVRDDPPSVLPMTYPPAPKTLWRNDGGLRFTDVTAQAGVADEQGKTLGVLFADFDLDGWLDLFCANDVTLNNFFRNRGDGTFESLAFDVGLDDPRGGMGVALADIDDDTDLDLAVTYWQTEPNGLYRNNVIRQSQKRTRIPTFEDVGLRNGFANSSVGKVKWGISMSDLDCDGRLDAAILSGYTSPDYDTTTLCLPQPPLLLFGRRDGSFEDVTSGAYGDFFGREWNGRGLATSDYDGDGDLDFLVTQNNGDAVLLRNDGGAHGNWLEVELRGDGKRCPRDPAGARVTLKVGDRSLTRVLLLGSSYLCGDSKLLHFGLGEAASYDSLTVAWPGGETTTHPGGIARERIRIELPAAR